VESTGNRGQQDVIDCHAKAVRDPLNEIEVVTQYRKPSLVSDAPVEAAARSGMAEHAAQLADGAKET
jgi:hypothetical protein